LTSKVFVYSQIKYYNDESLSIKLQPKNERRKLFIYTRGAHGLLKEGAPSGVSGLPSVGDKGATSPNPFTKCQSNPNQRRGRHLYGLWAATSRGRHLSKRGAPPFPHVLKSKRICHQSQSNQSYLVPFDLLIDFAINFSPKLSPFILFLF
jgi:hypothetical protein